MKEDPVFVIRQFPRVPSCAVFTYCRAFVRFLTRHLESNVKRVTVGGSEASVSTGSIGCAPTGSINFICCCTRVVFFSRRSLASRSQSTRLSLRENHRVSEGFGALPAHLLHALQLCATISAEKSLPREVICELRNGKRVAFW